MSMTPEQQREFDEYNEMFATAGWRRLVETAEKQVYEHQADAIEAPNWERVCYLRGRASMLAELVNFPNTLQIQFNMLAEEDDDAPL